MEKIIIKIDHDEVQEICRADAMFSSACSIITKSIADNINIYTPLFESYEDKCANYYIEFEALKNQLEKKYILSNEQFKDLDVRWHLDYSTDELAIEIVN